MKVIKGGLRRSYLLRFGLRVCLMAVMAVMVFTNSGEFESLDGIRCIKRFGFLQVMWLIWMFDMFMQLIPVFGRLPLGSRKLFRRFYEELAQKLSWREVHKRLRKTHMASVLIAVIWIGLVLALGGLYRAGILGKGHMLLVSTVFYVCDLICVLFFCPFRVWFLKNRCCTTCRIFNWDHLMMFSPLIFVGGLYAISLFAMALVVFLAWEITVIIHPERFLEDTNSSLKCQNCKDVLCDRANCVAKATEGYEFAHRQAKKGLKIIKKQAKRLPKR